MAGARRPGVEGLGDCGSSVRDGTLCMQCSPRPGPLGLAGPGGERASDRAEALRQVVITTAGGHLEFAHPAPGDAAGPTRSAAETVSAAAAQPEGRARVAFGSITEASTFLAALPLFDSQMAQLRELLAAGPGLGRAVLGDDVIQAASRALARNDLSLFHRPLARQQVHAPAPRRDAAMPAAQRGAAAAPAKPHVGPVIVPMSLVVVVQKLYTDSTGKTLPYTKPKRQRIVLTTNTNFDGTGMFARSAPTIKFFKSATGKDELAFDGAANVFKGAALSAGVTLYAEAATASGAMNDVLLTLRLSGGSKIIDPPAVGRGTAVEATLDICKARPAAGAAPPPLSRDDKIGLGRSILMQSTRHDRDRAMLIVRKIKPADYNGDLRLKARSGHVGLFLAEKPNTGDGQMAPFTFPAGDVSAKEKTFWVEGLSASGAMRDTGFQLGLWGIEDDADSVNVTVVDAVLDLCKSRSKSDKAGALPAPLSFDDKTTIGRFVHEQDAGKHHGRALLVVRAVKPKDFDESLVLEVVNAAKTELYQNEKPVGGEAATACPHTIDYKGKKNEDHPFWVQGKLVSGALRDAGYELHLKDDRPKNCDSVALTVCKFTDLTASIPATPTRTRRYANDPVPRHTYARSGAQPAHFDEDETQNLPFALIEDSVVAADPIRLSVKVAPAHVPVLWSVLRDDRPGGQGDHANVVALRKPPPAHQADAAAAADPLKRQMLADGVGTFHIRAFVDCNGSGGFEQHIDSEPHILMIAVLIRVEGRTNTSRANGSNPAASITVVGGVGVATGNFANGLSDAVHQVATVTVTGGGKDGQRGLDMLFAGWVNNELDSGPVGEDAVATYIQAAAPPLRPLPLPRSRISVRISPAARAALRAATGGNVFLPGGAAPPGAWDLGPVLDICVNANGGTGGDSVVGTEGGPGTHGPPVPIVKTPLVIGARWTVEMWDSPGDGAPAAHGGYAPTVLSAYRFNLDFSTDLVFWTNTTKTAVPTGGNEPAHRLYSSVQRNTWSIRVAIAFNAAGVAVAPPAKPTVTLKKDNVPTRRATPIAATAETRSPLLLNMLAIDARN